MKKFSLKDICLVLITLSCCLFVYSNCIFVEVFKNNANYQDDAMQFVVVNKITKKAYWENAYKKNVVIINNSSKNTNASKNSNNKSIWDDLEEVTDYSNMSNQELMNRIKGNDN